MSSPDKKTVIIICGPTASGKTSLAIELARYFHTEIISTDSRQCYKELQIGVARPAEVELSEVKHHFIASHSVSEIINAAFFEQIALEKANDLFQEKDIVILVGGTGLYIRVFEEGLDAIPAVDDALRKKIIENYEVKGMQWLQDELKEKDPSFYAAGEIQNPQRMMRALEVIGATGKSILEFRTKTKQKRNFDIIKIGLELPKENLHQNIDARVDKMIAEGLVDEVRSLTPYRDMNALQTVGYKEIFKFIDGKLSLEEAIDEIKKNTRQYAKRQMTWFKKDRNIKWFGPSQTKEIIQYIEGEL